jgi:hypothetical protein
MMGRKEHSFAPLINVSLEELVPQDHFYRHLERTLDLSCVREFVQETYAGKAVPPLIRSSFSSCNWSCSLRASCDARYSRCCWWIIRPAFSKPTSGQFLVLKQSRPAISSRSEAPSKLLCGYLHPSSHDMRQPPIWLVSLSSGSRRQRAREHLARWCAIEAHFRQLPEGNTTSVNVVKAATYLAPKGGRGP